MGLSCPLPTKILDNLPIFLISLSFYPFATFDIFDAFFFFSTHFMHTRQ